MLSILTLFFSNHIPWIIIGICYVVCPLLMLSIRVLLARENKRRDNEPVDETYDDVYIEVIDSEGKRVEQKVPKVCSRSCLQCGPPLIRCARNIWT